MLLLRTLLIAGLAILARRAAFAAPTAGEELFESKVRPILIERCQKCHGAKTQWSNLRLDSRAGALTGGDGGPALVVGKPEESEIISRITDPDDDVRMPPPKAGKRLSLEQIEGIKQWIKLGAPWPDSSAPAEDAKAKLRREHWAFQPVRHVEPPEVREQSKVVNPIDGFILAKLKSAGLQMSAAADRRTLIERATYDLTGLPPTPEEISQFVSDTSSEAYEHVVDRLLASPRYGEQWGRYWLDIARYSDTKGYVYARENRFFVNSSLYRDWVIRAFNEDLPYDQFVLKQIAADQLTPSDPESLAAMGFLTLGRRMLGITPDIIEDRIDVVSRGLLGLTVGCARCHDHKFDPIPTADYYSLYGVFENCVERQVALPEHDGATKNDGKFESELKKRQKALADTLTQRREEAADQVRSKLREYLLAQFHLDDYPDLVSLPVADKGELIPAFVRRWDVYLKKASKDGDPVFAAWAAYSQIPADQFSSRAPDVTKRLLDAPSRINPRVVQAFATPPASMEEVAKRYSTLFAEVIPKWEKLCGEAKTGGLEQPTSLPDAADEQLRQVLYANDSPCIIPDEPIVNTEYYWDIHTVEEIWKLQASVDSWLLENPTKARCAVVLNDRANLVDAQIFRRGNPMTKGETVPRRFLEVVAGPDRKPFKHGSGRLELAQAIVDPANPLTSRVWANRVWLHHFGAGLVSTPSDFGARSSAPTHPELLDWLASEFIRHGWSTKWLHRTIMLSATYQQSSQPPADSSMLARAQERDPDNRLLWRMNPHRLNFEQFRDTLIATSGELDTTMGGKGADLLGLRRTVYVLVDRQYLPSVFNVFDFASPDFHSSQRAETTTPQQALFALNSPYVADRARKIAARIQQEANTPESHIARAYQIVLRRDPTQIEIQDGVHYLQESVNEAPGDSVASDPKAWSYGYGQFDVKSGKVNSFRRLPHFTGAAWQGGTLWPDRTLGWTQLTAKGGHPGNDEMHAAIRRWTAHTVGVLSIKSDITHQEFVGDGVRCWIVSSRHGVLKSESVFNKRRHLDVDSLVVEPGDHVDFVVDRGENLNSDQFIWLATIAETTSQVTAGASSDSPHALWNSENDFPRVRLLPLEQLVQMLLCSNEFMFVD